MGPYRIYITVFVAFVCKVLISNGQENAMSRLPDSLLECYNSSGLYNKENLLPMTITTLIDIIRKVESSQDGYNMNLLSLTTSILHRFKLDGVERNPLVADQDGVIPYSVVGPQFYKHRLLLIMLIPQNRYPFPNNTLTAVERCTLHFMLSKSVERYQRGDESNTCNQLSTTSSQQQQQTYRRRRRRDVDNDNNSSSEQPPLADVIDLLTTYVPLEDDGSGIVDTDISLHSSTTTDTTTTTIEQHVNITDVNNPEKYVSNDTTNVPASASDDVEIVKQVDEKEKKGNMFLDPQENLRLYGVVPQTSNKYMDDIDHEESENIQDSWPLLGADDISYSPRALSTVALSDCPVENGVVFTSSGAVTIARVLAGIVSGIEPQTVPLANLVATSTRSNALTEAITASATAIDNRWAATLAGELAEVTLYDGPLGTMQAGAAGGWNNTQIPRWYFLRDGTQRSSHLTDTEIRGSIDGLTLARSIQSWYQQAPELRLSEVLEMYYSETGLFQTRFRGCQRKDNFVGVAPATEMAQQASSFAVILDPQGISPARLSYNVIRNYSQIATNQLTTYVPSRLVDQVCLTTREASVSAQANIAVDLLVVIDSAWEYTYITRLIASLMDRLQVNPYFSNITIMAGQQPQILLNSTSRQTDFFTNFTLDAYNTLTRGMNLRALLGSNLVQYFQAKLDEERRLNIAGGQRTAVLFIPAVGFSVSDDDLQACLQSFNWYKLRLPDVKFFYLISGNSDRYRSLVDDSTRDIFSLTTGVAAIDTTLSPIATRLITLQQRIVNPNCGSDWTERSYTSVQFSAALDPFTVSYYRLHPNYFFSSTAGVLRVQGSSSGSLRVCWSRSVEHPNNATVGSSSVSCQVVSSNAYEIPLASACDSSIVSECQPLYISIESTSDSTSFLCNDRTVCRSVRNLRYFVSHEGLGCRAGSGHFVVNSFATIFTTISLLLYARSFY